MIPTDEQLDRWAKDLGSVGSRQVHELIQEVKNLRAERGPWLDEQDRQRGLSSLNATVRANWRERGERAEAEVQRLRELVQRNDRILGEVQAERRRAYDDLSLTRLERDRYKAALELVRVSGDRSIPNPYAIATDALKQRGRIDGLPRESDRRTLENSTLETLESYLRRRSRLATYDSYRYRLGCSSQDE